MSVNNHSEIFKCCVCFFLLQWIFIGCVGQTTRNNDLIYVSNGTDIIKINKLTSSKTVIFNNVDRVVGLMVDVRQQMLFFSDIGSQKAGIYSMDISSSTYKAKRIVSDTGRVNGLAVEWQSKLIVWTDEILQTIEVAKYDGSNRKIIVDSDLSWPRGVAVYPKLGLLFWGDQGTRRIERSLMDGSQRKAIVLGVTWPNQLTIDMDTKRLFYVDAYEMTIYSCDLDGEDVRLHRQYRRQDVGTLFGLARDSNAIYFSTWYQGTVFSAKDNEGSLSDKTAVVDGLGDSNSELFSLAMGSLETQPVDPHPCTETPKPCSHMCLITGETTYLCTCPTYGGLALDVSGRVCKEPTELLIYANKGGQYVGFMPILPKMSTRDKYIIARSKNPVGVAIDSYKREIFWSDVEERKIYVININGTGRAVLLDESDGIGIVDGMAFDEEGRNLYFANRGVSPPRIDGSAYAWARIELVNVDSLSRKTIVFDCEKPRAIAIDNKRKHLYFTDWGSSPRLVRTDLDGNNVIRITEAKLSNPNGLAIYNNHLFLIDSNFNNKTTNAVVIQYNLETHKWSIEDYLTRYLRIPFGIAVNEDYVFVSDWEQANDVTGNLTIIDRYEQSSKFLSITNVRNPSSLIWSVKPLKQSGDICRNSVCKHRLAIPRTQQQGIGCNCICPDFPADFDDGCLGKDSFLAVADLNTIKYNVAEDNKSGVFVFGGVNASFTAVEFDYHKQTVYYSDMSSSTIYSYEIPTRHVTVLDDKSYNVDDITIDQANDILYWTTYNTTSKKGFIVRKFLGVHVKGYEILVDNLIQPRAIVYDAETRSLIWTEFGHGSSGGRVSRCLVDTPNTREIVVNKIFRWPNAVELHNNRLYIADGYYKKIEVLVRKGTRFEPYKTIQLGTLRHIYDIKFYNNDLYISDWYSNKIHIWDESINKVKGSLYRFDLPARICPIILRYPHHGSTDQPIGTPTFQGCPEDEVVTLTLNEGDKNVSLDITLNASDANGTPLNISGTHPIPPGVNFQWAKDPYHLLYYVTDKQGLSAACGFSVKVKDINPPWFEECKSNMTVDTVDLWTAIHWEEPVAIDNVAVVTLVKPAKGVGSLFATGKHVLRYVAFDGEGNTATCNITVSVKAIVRECKRPKELVDPIGGSIFCNKTPAFYECRVKCNPENYVLNVNKEYHHMFCIDGQWGGQFPVDYHKMACRRSVPYRMIEETLNFYLEGQCHLTNPTHLRGIKSSIVKSLSGIEICMKQRELCESKSISVQCTEHNIRKRREVAPLTDIVKVEMLVHLWASNDNISDVQRSLEAIKHDLRQFFINFKTEENGQVYRSHSLLPMDAQPVLVLCPNGTVPMAHFCVFCPSGYFHNLTSDTCDPCPIGTPSTVEGALACDSCNQPHGCALQSTNVSPLAENSNTTMIIVIALVPTVIVILICVLVILYRIRKRRLKGKYDVDINKSNFEEHQLEPINKRCSIKDKDSEVLRDSKLEIKPSCSKDTDSIQNTDTETCEPLLDKSETEVIKCSLENEEKALDLKDESRDIKLEKETSNRNVTDVHKSDSDAAESLLSDKERDANTVVVT